MKVRCKKSVTNVDCTLLFFKEGEEYLTFIDDDMKHVTYDECDNYHRISNVGHEFKDAWLLEHFDIIFL